MRPERARFRCAIAEVIAEMLGNKKIRGFIDHQEKRAIRATTGKNSRCEIHEYDGLQQSSDASTHVCSTAVHQQNPTIILNRTHVRCRHTAERKSNSVRCEQRIEA